MQFVCGTLVVWAKHHESKTTMEAGFEKSGVTPCPVDTSGGYQEDFWSFWLAENLPPSRTSRRSNSRRWVDGRWLLLV